MRGPEVYSAAWEAALDLAEPTFYTRLIMRLFMLVFLLANWNSIISKASTSLDKMYHINITFNLAYRCMETKEVIFVMKKKNLFSKFPK